MYAGISEPGMRTYLLRVRRDRGVPPRGNSRPAHSALFLAEGGAGGGGARPMGLALGQRWGESRLPIVDISGVSLGQKIQSWLC